jgi:putative SOS response-associated peptidase YedK
MCGRYSLTTPVEAPRQLFLFENSPNLPPRYNIAPTQTAPVVRISPDHGGRELALLRWGLVPPWSEGPDGQYPMFDARAQTVASRPAFRGVLRDSD